MAGFKPGDRMAAAAIAAWLDARDRRLADEAEALATLAALADRLADRLAATGGHGEFTSGDRALILALLRERSA